MENSIGSYVDNCSTFKIIGVATYRQTTCRMNNDFQFMLQRHD